MMKKMSSLAIASILEELRCMDGELFKAEICQRLFLWLKAQATESLETAFAKSPAEYSKILDLYKSWSQTVCDEELSALQEKAGGKEELNSVWIAVSMHWVRLNKKSESAKASVKIKTPDARELLKKFFVLLCSKTWCIKGELWSMDPMKQDFVFREVFRQSVGNSVHFIQDEERPVAVKESRDPAGEESDKKEEEQKREEAKLKRELREKEIQKQNELDRLREEQARDRLREEQARDRLREEQARDEARARELQLMEQRKEEEKERESERKVKSEEEEEGNEVKKSTSESREEEEEDDDIGPDDSVSHFFGGSRIEPPSFPSPPPKRYADAGTVLYSAAPKRVLVKPITLKLENPIQSISEDE